MQSEDSIELGMIGLGNMGLPIARNLAAAGFTLVAYDIDAARCASVPSAIAARSPAEVAQRCRRTVVLVSTGAQLSAVLFGDRGMVDHGHPGDTILCMSTVAPTEFMELHKRCADSGISLIDAPVSGGAEGAASRALSIMVGSEPAQLLACDDIFRAMASRTFHVGSAGHGLAMKLINNMLIQVNMVAVCEALVLARKAGLDLTTVHDVVTASSGNSVAFERRAPRVIRRDFVSGGTVSISFKDQGLEVDFARRLGVPLLLAAVSHQVYGMAMNAGLADKDAIAVVQLYEQMAGIA